MKRFPVPSFAWTLTLGLLCTALWQAALWVPQVAYHRGHRDDWILRAQEHAVPVAAWGALGLAIFLVALTVSTLVGLNLRRAILSTIVFAAVWFGLSQGYHLYLHLGGAGELPFLWRGFSEVFRVWGGVVMFLVGLAWSIWLMETAALACERKRYELQAVGDPGPSRWWNPLNPRAWYYGEGRKLNQSLVGLTTYVCVFALLFILMGRAGCDHGDIFELPVGGGQDMIQQTVRIQKVIRKKFVINPYSSILFNPPPIDQIDPQILEVTRHMHAVGQGAGDGAGFAAGTSRGKARFIRLQYTGGDWDHNFGIGLDQNMLTEYRIRTAQKTADTTEAIPVTALRGFPKFKSPAFVFMTGQKGINLSKDEVKVLREYLVDKHGMIFADNGGSLNFHNQFIAMMREVLRGLPDVNPDPVAVPLDDIIHRRPYPLPFLPIVSPHGGSIALGWKHDGRWIAYYHPGELSDAWADGHAGVRTEVWQACYMLGVNIMFYAHREYGQWLLAQKSN